MTKCKGCGAQWEDQEVQPILDYKDRVKPGEPMPSGACPECGELCLSVKEPPSQEWLNRLVGENNKIASALLNLRELMIEVDAPSVVFAAGGLLTTMHDIFRKVVSEEMSLLFIPVDELEHLSDEILKMVEQNTQKEAERGSADEGGSMPSGEEEAKAGN